MLSRLEVRWFEEHLQEHHWCADWATGAWTPGRVEWSRPACVVSSLGSGLCLAASQRKWLCSRRSGKCREFCCQGCHCQDVKAFYSIPETAPRLRHWQFYVHASCSWQGSFSHFCLSLLMLQDFILTAVCLHTRRDNSLH